MRWNLFSYFIIITLNELFKYKRINVSLRYVQCIVFPSPLSMEILGDLSHFVESLVLILISCSNCSCILAMLVVGFESHSVFRRWTIFDRIVYDDQFSVVLGFFLFGCVASISAPAALLYPLDRFYSGDG